MMKVPLVVGVDGSEPSLRAVDWATDEAVLRKVPLRLVYAARGEHLEATAPSTDGSYEPKSAEDIIDGAARRARRRRPDLEISAAVLSQEPVAALLQEGHNASALVLASRGRSGIADLVLGSVSRAVAARAECPVIVLRASHDNQVKSGMRQRIVLGVGEEPVHRAAVRFALQEAEHRQVPLEAVSAWRRPVHESTDHQLAAGEPARLREARAARMLEAALCEAPAAVQVHRRTVEGPARAVLLDASHHADLLIVGARRSQGHFGLRLGPVAHTVLHRSACPVAIVPQQS